MSTMTKNVAAVITALTCVGLAYAPSASAAATVPLTLTEQGRLLDDMNVPVDAVGLPFTFALYTTPTAGAAIWTEKQTITPDKGYFSARLGEVAPFPATIFNGSQSPLYVGITIGADSEMSPRQQITSVPFALLSLNAVAATHAASADSATTATSATNATNATNASTAVGALDTRIKALEATVAALSAAPKAYGTSFFFSPPNCASAAGACRVDISAGGFAATPSCTVTMSAIDNTGYTENMVIQGTTPTSLFVWRGQYEAGGTSMSGIVTCVGH